VAGDEVVIADNLMAKGPRSENWGTAIHISGKGGAQAGPGYRISGNRFRSDNPHEVAFVRNRTVVPAVLEGNRIEGEVDALVGPGTVDAEPEASAPAIARDQGKRAPAPGAEEPAADPAAFDDLEARLRFLKRLFEEELITEQEYAAKKAELLEQM
jgi:hypothetical protein